MNESSTLEIEIEPNDDVENGDRNGGIDEDSSRPGSYYAGRRRRALIVACLAVVAAVAIALGVALSRGGGSEDGDDETGGSDPTTASPTPPSPDGGVSTPCLTCSWIQIGPELAGQEAGSLFGERVSIAQDGLRVAVSAPNGGGLDGRPFAGIVRVYDLAENGLQWTQIGQDIYGWDTLDRIRAELSPNVQRLAVGAPHHDGIDGTENQIGQVLVYELRSDSSWELLGDPIYGESPEDRSGDSLALSYDGSTVAIGATGNDGEAGEQSGHARVYRYNSANQKWEQLGGDVDGEYAGDYNGRSVSLSDDGLTLAVGAWQNNATGLWAGHVRVHRWMDSLGNWTQMGDDVDGTGKHHEAYVTSLSADGTTLAVNGDWSSDARIFKYDNQTHQWDQIGTLDGDSTWVDVGGISLSANGTRVAVSAPRHYAQDMSHMGVTRIYDYVGGTWRKAGEDIVGGEADEHFGFISLSEEGSRIAIGGPAYSNEVLGIAPRNGVVRLFELRAS